MNERNPETADQTPDRAETVPAPRVSVVVPVKNEADNVVPLIEEIHAALEGVTPFEVIYVDDGSDDATPQVLRDAKGRFPRLRVVRHAQSCGQSQAIHTGVTVARGELIATLDGDGQNDPADLPAMLERFDREGASGTPLMIIGHRQKRNDTFIRRLSSRVANKVRTAMLKDDTPDTGCGLKVFPRATFLRFPRFHHMHRFLAALMLREGGRVISVPVNHRAREHGTSKYGLWNRLWVSIVDLFGVWWLQRRVHNPVIESQD